MRTLGPIYCSILFSFVFSIPISSADYWTAQPDSISVGELEISPGVVVCVGTEVTLALTEVVDFDTFHYCLEDNKENTDKHEDTPLTNYWTVKKGGDAIIQQALAVAELLEFTPEEPGEYHVEVYADDKWPPPVDNGSTIKNRNDPQSATKTATITILKVDLDGQELQPPLPPQNWKDVPDNQEVNPGVLLVNGKTKLLVQDPGVNVGKYKISWPDLPGSKKLLLVGGAGGPESSIEVECTGPWPKEYRAVAAGNWDYSDSVEVTLTHSLVPCSDVVKLVILKVDIKAENGTDDPADGLCIETTKKFKAVVTPGMAGTYSWSTTSSKITLTDASSQTVTVNAGADASAAVDAEDLKVEFTPTGSSTTCDDTHTLTAVKVDVTDLQTTPYLPGTDNPTDATSMGDDVTVTYQISPSGYTVDLAGLYIKDKDDNVVYSDITINKSGGPHDVIWSVSEDSLRSVNSDKNPYKAEVKIRVNWTYDDDSKDLAITESEVTVVAETSTTTGNPVEECMEGRRITFTATASGFVSEMLSHTIDFTFHYKKADGTAWTDTDWSFDLIEDNTAVEDDVPDGDADHFFETPIHVTVSDDYTHTAMSPEIKIKVYELWIDYFRHAATDKDWKVVVGENIEYKAIASEDCTNWDWDMEDGVPDKWNPTGGNAKQGSAMKIPYSDLSGKDGDDFGEAYGTVNVFCEDEEGNNHHFCSTSMSPSEKAKVFFDPERNVDGGAPSTDKPPCWYLFWQNGAVPGLNEFEYIHNNYYGESNVIPKPFWWDVVIQRVAALAGPTLGFPGSGTHYPGGMIINGIEFGGATGIDCCTEVVEHENRHNFHAYEIIGGAADSDPAIPGYNYLGDGLPDPREAGLGCSPLLKDTFNVAGIKNPAYAGYGDDEYGVMVFARGKKGVAAKDWSKEGKQW